MSDASTSKLAVVHACGQKTGTPLAPPAPRASQSLLSAGMFEENEDLQSVG